MRERMEEHRAQSGLRELPQAHGSDRARRWRTSTRSARGATRDGGTLGTPIDASGELLDGTKVDGVVTLRQALLQQPEIFVGTVTEKLLTYALGRGLGYYDMPAVRAIVRDAARSDYRFSSIVLGIVNSTPFQKRIKAPESATWRFGRRTRSVRDVSRQRHRRSSRPCSSPRCRCPGGRSCGVWAPRWRCRCSNRWCLR